MGGDQELSLLQRLRMARFDPAGSRERAAYGLGSPGLTATDRALLLAILAKVDIEHDDIAEAVAHASDAWAALPPSADPVVVGELAALLANALTLSNRPDEALRILDDAAARPGVPAVGVVELQRAAVLYRLGAMELALCAADRAVGLLAPTSPVERARALNNRGIIRLYLGDLESGWEDFTEAEALYRAAGLDRAAAETAHNRSMIYARRGDVPRALAGFDAAERELLELACPIDAQIVARGEVLVQARLFDEVVELLPAVVERMTAGGMHADADEGRVYLAQSMVALRADGTVDYVEELAGTFRALGRAGWAAVLADLAIEARIERDGLASVSSERAVAVARELDELGMRWFAPGCWLRAARAADALGDAESARAALEVVAARQESVSERVLAFEATARLALLDGRPGFARRAVERGLAFVDAMRGAVEATELRAVVSGWGDGLAQLGVELSIATGRPRSTLVAVERWRGSATGSRPVRPSRDRAEADLLTRLRSANALLAAALRHGGGVAEAAARVRQAERELTTWGRSRTGAGRAHRRDQAPITQLVEEVGDATLVDLFECSGDLLAVVVHRGRVRRRPVGPAAAIRDVGVAVMQSLRRLALVAGTPAAGLVAATARAHVGRARTLVAAPLASALRSATDLVVVPPPHLHDLPWRLLLDVGCPVAVAPSAGSWLRAGNSRADSAGPVVVAAGPGLPGAAEEARQVAALHDGAHLLTGSDATVERVGALLDGAALAHLAAHATVRPTSPFFSALQLADGPATPYDLEGLARAPRTMVLPACSAGQVSPRSAGELVGLATVLIAAGTACLVAPTIPIPDESSVEVVLAFHRRLRAGTTTGEAVAAVSGAVNVDDPAGLVAACTLTCFGRGDLRL